MPYSRRSVLIGATAFGAVIGLPSLAIAQSFPDKAKSIRGISPSPPGSTVDTLARAYAQAMGEILGATIMIDDRPGAEGVIGMQAAKTAPADGYTILFTSLSTQVINPHLFKQLAYDPLKDVIPVAGTMRVPLLMAVGPSMSPFKSPREFIAVAKAAPGKYTFGSVSSTTRLAGEMFAKAAGIKLLNVPYKNFSDLMSDLMSGRADMLFADAPSCAPFFNRGIRPFSALAATRITNLPDVPTIQEQGVPGLELVGWHALYVPANTPLAVVATLRNAARQASNSKVVKDYFSNFGTEPLDLSGEEFANFQRTEFEKWGKAVRDAGLQGTL